METLPGVLVGNSLSWLGAREVAAFRETSRKLADGDVPRLCLEIGGDVFDSTLRATLKHRGLSLPGAKCLGEAFHIEIGGSTVCTSPRAAPPKTPYQHKGRNRKNKKQSWKTRQLERSSPDSIVLSSSPASPPAPIHSPRQRRSITPTTTPVPRLDLDDDEEIQQRLAAGSALRILRVAELQRIYEGLDGAITAVDPQITRGYWLSKNWASHARRYCEAKRRELLDDVPQSSGQRRGRSRSSSSEALPPWPDANADLLCDHGFLAPRSMPRAKRVIVDRACWRAIAARFPLSTKLKISTAADCRTCRTIIEDRHLRKQAERAFLFDEKQRRLSELDDLDEPTCPVASLPLEKKDDDDVDDVDDDDPVGEEETLARRPDSSTTTTEDLLSPRSSSTSSLLRRLASKDRARRGVPASALSPVAAAALASGVTGVPPLVAGRYHLVPRRWLQSWRASLRSAKTPRPGPPTTTDLLCVAHGLPLVAPELRAYLSGDLPALPLNPATTTTCEIVDASEWRALNALFPVDFAVAFDLDIVDFPSALRLTWLTEPCAKCDSTGLNFGNLHFRARTGKGKHKYRDDLDFVNSTS